MTVRRTNRRHPTPIAEPKGSRLPRVLEPMLPARAPEPFDSPGHIFELLWDGVRALAFIENDAVRLQDAFGRDITHRFPELAAISGRLRESGVVIDGEIVCLDEDGKPDFHRLHPRLGLDEPARIAGMSHLAPATFQAFDILYREGQPLAGWALRRRKEMLKTIVRPSETVAVPDWVERDGIAFFEAAREHRQLGIVAKEMESRYLAGQRSQSWLSLRVFPRAEFVIGGYTFGAKWDPRDPSRRSQEPFSSLLLGLHGNDGALSYVGEVRGGFDTDDMFQLIRSLDDLATPLCPFVEQPDAGRLVFWCRPDLVATVRYAGWAPDRRLRFPVFEALRPDVPAESCIARSE